MVDDGTRSPQAPPLVASPTEFPALGGSSEECFGAGWRSCTMKVLGYTFYIMRSTLIEHCKSLDPYDSVQSLITI